jgi:hypothetical protein
MVRDLRSTVVVQATQREADYVQTRTVRNHNHSHALSVLYYEVVRHYLVETRAVRERDVIFVRRDPLTFDAGLAHAWRFLLRAALLEPRYADDFDNLNTAVPGLWRYKSFIVEITSPIDGDVDVENDRVVFRALTRGGIEQWPLQSYYVTPPGADSVSMFRRNTNTFIIPIAASRPIPTDALHRVGINMIARGDSRWTLKAIRVSAVVGPAEFATEDKVLDIVPTTEVNYHFHDDGDLWLDIGHPELTANRLEVRTAASRLSEADGLIRHLNEFRTHYSRHLWLNEDPDVRLTWLSRFPWPKEDPMGSLSDYVDPAPLGFYGPYQAFAWGPDRLFEPGEIESVERIATLPTRGAFAETQLSHCNASEIIDDTRFWDWSISPCRDEAPEISGVSPGSRFNAAMLGAPTAFGESAVSIREPAEAPAPTGLGAILEQVMASDVFRDMSAKEQLAGVLTELTKAAASVESKRLEGLTKLGEADASVERARLDAEAARQRQAQPSGPSPTLPEEPASPIPAPAATERGVGETEEPSPDRTPRPRTRTRTAPEPEPTPVTNRLRVNFYDHNDAPLVGQHLVKVWGRPTGGTGSQLVGQGSTNSNSTVGVELRSDLERSLLVQVYTSRAMLPDWMNLESLRRFVTRSTPVISRRLIRLISVVSQSGSIVVDPSDPATYSLNYKLNTLEQDVRVEGHIALQNEISAALRRAASVGLGDILPIDLGEDSEVTGGVGSELGAGGEVETTFRLRLILDSYRLPVVGSSVRSGES